MRYKISFLLFLVTNMFCHTLLAEENSDKYLGNYLLINRGADHKHFQIIKILKDKNGYYVSYKHTEGRIHEPIEGKAKISGKTFTFSYMNNYGYKSTFTGVFKDNGIFGGFDDGSLMFNGQEKALLVKEK